MRRNGDIKYILAGILAVIVLGFVLYGFSGKIKEVTFITKLFPSFEQEAPDGTSIVGIKLTKGKTLDYFNGEKWKEIKNSEGLYRLGKYELKPDDIQKSLSDFYKRSERRPKQLSLEVNSWRYWDVDPEIFSDGSGIKKITPKIKNTFIKNEFIVFDNEYYPESITLDYNDEVKIRSGDTFPSFMALDIEEKQGLIAKVIEWRDSILEGNKCEKFLELSFKENGIDKTESYTVRKIDDRLFIDLNNPVSGDQEWNKVDCLGIKNYDDENNKILDNVNKNVLVDFKYTERNWKNTDENLIWKSYATWEYNGKERRHYEILKIMDKSFFLFLWGLAGPSNKNVFYDLSVTFNSERNDQGIFIDGSKILGLDFIKGVEFDGGMSVEQRSEFVYRVLTEYYDKLVMVGTT